MIPKLRSCIDAIESGVGRAHILDGRVPHALLLEFFTREGIGTMITDQSTTGDGRGTRDHHADDHAHVRRARGARRRARHADLRSRCRSRSCGARARSSTTAEGKRYLDFLAGLAVTSLGHAHPAVADALADQARTLLHVSNLYYNDIQPQVAAKLDALLGGDGRVFFCNSGAEANECAIKLARRYGQANGGPERYHVISAYGSFHGRTLTTLAATGQPQKQETFQPLPSGFRQVAFADVDALAAAMDERVCAVMLEPVQGEGGVQPSPPGYLEAVRALCDEREALLLDGRGADRSRPHRRVVRLPALRRSSRRRHDGEGARQRRPDRRVLGARRRRQRVQAG